jgi:ankyrin repeat protein
MTISALVQAVLDGDLPEAEAALRAGANPDAKDPLGYAPLHLAAARGHVQMVQLLLTAGADPLLPETRTGASPLHKAAQGGSVGVARLLLDHGAHIDQRSPLHGNTPLIDAVWHKHLPMVEFLLERGADTEVRGRLGYTAGDMRALAGHDDMTPFEEAIERARRDRAARRDEPLRRAARDGDAEAARAAIAAGADLDSLDADGQNPLLDAAMSGHAEVVAVLLDAGADPRIVDRGNMLATPGHKAGYMGHAEVARLLVADPRFEIDAQGPYNGFTALHDAVWHGHRDAAAVYLEAGARLDLRSHYGTTPLEMARQYGYADIVALLEDAEKSARVSPP